MDKGRDALIGQFADNLPLASMRPLKTEGEYWRTVENPCYKEGPQDEEYWTEVERAMGSEYSSFHVGTIERYAM